MRPTERPTEPEEGAPERGLSGPQPCSDALAEAGVRVEALLHSGTVADVWRATLASGERVALKRPKREWLEHAGAVELLRREHRVLSALRHPHVVRAVRFFDGPGCSALATEYVGGGDLVALAGAAPRHWVAAACDVVAALVHVHGRGYAHGDVKARNVLLSQESRATLIDFGSALALGSPLPPGTARTAAHEPVHCGYARAYRREARATPAGDVYALAVLLYELLAGRLPFGPRPAEHAGALPPPALGAAPPVAALAERVMATLGAADEAALGTLTEYANVLESVRSRAAPARGNA